MYASSRYRMFGNDSCFITIDQAIAIAPDLDKRHLSRIIKGSTFIRFARWDEGIDHLNTVMAEDSLDMSDAMKSRGLNALAILYEGKESFDDQVLYAQRALDFALEAKDTIQLIDAYVSIMRAFNRLGRNGEANDYGMIAMDYALVFNDKIKLYKVAHNLFSPNIAEIEKEPFADYLIRFIEQTKPKELPSDGFHTGFQFLKQYNIGLDQWKLLYNKLLEKDSPFLPSLGMRYSYALKESGLLERALRLNDSIYLFAIKQGNPVSAKILTQMSYQILKEQEKYFEANQMLEKYYAFKDSLQNVEIQNNVNELNIRFETARKDREIAEQKVEILENQRVRNYLFAGILGLLLLGIFVVYSLRRRHAYQVGLADRDKEIQLQKIEKLEQEQKILALDYMLMGEENERKRIAKDLHDSLGALLSTAKLQLKNLYNELTGDSTSGVVDETEAIIEHAAQEVRRISHDMMPDALVNLGLVAAVDDLANKLNENSTIKVSAYSFDIDESSLSDQNKVGIYRIVQELTQNVYKHAQASHMVIQLTQEDGHLRLEVEDDGVGFDPDQMNEVEGIGLKNIRSRVQYLNGTFLIDSQRGGPTVFTISIPV